MRVRVGRNCGGQSAREQVVQVSFDPYRTTCAIEEAVSGVADGEQLRILGALDPVVELHGRTSEVADPGPEFQAVVVARGREIAAVGLGDGEDHALGLE